MAVQPDHITDVDTLEHKAELDATGLKCPLPVLRTRKSIKPLVSGEILKIIATDKATKRDFPAFCEVTGDELLGMKEEGETLLYWIKKK